MLNVEMAKQKQSGAEVKRIGRFGLVGVMNTVLDFVIFNVLRLVIASTIASVISGTVAMINSYIFNQRFTFKAKRVSRERTILFFGFTIFGLYVIRPLVIHFFTSVWLWPANTAYNIAHTIGLPFSQKFITDNVGLVCAIIIVLSYNYICYKKWVFVK